MLPNKPRGIPRVDDRTVELEAGSSLVSLRGQGAYSVASVAELAVRANDHM